MEIVEYKDMNKSKISFQIHMCTLGIVIYAIAMFAERYVTKVSISAHKYVQVTLALWRGVGNFIKPNLYTYQ